VPILRHQGRGLVVLLPDRQYLARFADLSRETAFQSCIALRDKGYTCTILDRFPAGRQDIAANHDGRLAATAAAIAP
jgi:hypothetical protein